ncbi:hypothetical protein F2Q68_00011909 [Brassica cretica]|uniref:Uncharacterized protein n=1 Tax=Brassica cretica TaxID=69181 RepID=A0A8S9L3E0_BRACR|nr:hypothetical protein F2Q68_00011909 [Brassica cretica]
MLAFSSLRVLIRRPLHSRGVSLRWCLCFFWYRGEVADVAWFVVSTQRPSWSLSGRWSFGYRAWCFDSFRCWRGSAPLSVIKKSPVFQSEASFGDYVSLDLLFTALCPAPPTGFGGSLFGVYVSRVSLFPSPMTPELVLSEEWPTTQTVFLQGSVVAIAGALLGLGVGFKRCVASLISPALVAIARLCGKYLESSPIGRLALHRQ